jgi:hypothetical protein
MKLIDAIRMLVPAAGLAYLALYLYGLVMRVFSPLELPVFTALAALTVVGLMATMLVARRHAGEVSVTRDPVVRATRAQRERRGF